MKLVDILARELKVWPGDVGAITQDSKTGELLDYFHSALRGGNEREVSVIAHDSGRAHDSGVGSGVTRTQWQAAVDALNDIPKFPSDDVEWTGEGLPPVGEWCEILSTPEPKGSWCKGKILYVSRSSCVWCWDEKQIDMCANTFDMEFRPIRTPEQIAAEERLHTIRNACTDIAKIIEPWNDKLDCSHAIRATIEAMIDKGYRKFEIVEGE